VRLPLRLPHPPRHMLKGARKLVRRFFNEEIMNSSLKLFQLTAFLLLCIVSASAQTAAGDGKAFNKEGLSFSYPASWTFNDTSNADASHK
jgi:hypothetical protein